MSKAQEFIPISEITNDIVLLKDGAAALILKTSAVNFGLLSQREQIALIYTFAQMLNSLSFPIQIVLHSERLNIDEYINLLNQALKLQTNPLLAELMANYIQFIQQTIKDNEVLDKKFYIVIPAYSIEMGIKLSRNDQLKKARTLLLPRRDQIIRQLSRLGLKTKQLDNNKLLETFFDLYNQDPNMTIDTNTGTKISTPTPDIPPVNLGTPQNPYPQPTTQPTPAAAATPPISQQPTAVAAPPPQPTQPPRNNLFVVEELS